MNLNPGGAIIPFFQSYDTPHFARYQFALKYLGHGIVVDCGCGYGFGTHFMASNQTNLTLGFDIDTRCVRYARAHYKLPNLEFKLLNEMKIPVDDCSVGVITFFDVIEHLFESQVDDFFCEAMRVLIPGGLIVGSTPNANLRHDEDFVYHVREYTLDDLRSIALARGFELHVFGQGTHPSQLKGVRALALELLPTSLKRSYLLKALQSLVVAVKARNQSLNDHDANIGHLDEYSSTELIFLMQKGGPARDTSREARETVLKDLRGEKTSHEFPLRPNG